LKMMWSVGSVFDGAKDGSAFTRSSFLVRRKVAALRLQVRHTKETASEDCSVGRTLCERNEVAIWMVACVVAVLRCIERRSGREMVSSLKLESRRQKSLHESQKCRRGFGFD
jgi:hypothetical protein